MKEGGVEQRQGIPLRAVVPNAITALALCVGLTGVRFAIAGEWDNAIYAIVVAGSSRFTLPAFICSTRSAGSASTSTFKPTASAVFGLTPGPTPPSLAPAIA